MLKSILIYEMFTLLKRIQISYLFSEVVGGSISQALQCRFIQWVNGGQPENQEIPEAFKASITFHFWLYPV